MRPFGWAPSRLSAGLAHSSTTHSHHKLSIYAPFLLGSLKAVGWAKRLLFNESPYKLALGTLRDIQKVRCCAMRGLWSNASMYKVALPSATLTLGNFQQVRCGVLLCVAHATPAAG